MRFIDFEVTLRFPYLCSVAQGDLTLTPAK